MTHKERAVGCMVGSAYGDSLGAAVEFIDTDEIKALYGDHGITELEPVYGQVGNITDDTQMALATARGLTGVAEAHQKNHDLVTDSIWEAYLEWYDSQTVPNQVRAPGNTCLSALASGKKGTIAEPLNHSAGCGAIMRAHPIGIARASSSEAFVLGTQSGAITHGHPNGYVPAGALSLLTSVLMDDKEFVPALEYTQSIVSHLPSGIGDGTVGALHKAREATSGVDTFKIIDNEVGGTGGWQGHDALAIGVFAVLQAPDDPLEAIRIAVNHSGDSDSTGAIAGAIMGTMHGPEAFMGSLREQGVALEHTNLLGQLAVDLARLRKAS